MVGWWWPKQPRNRRLCHFWATHPPPIISQRTSIAPTWAAFYLLFPIHMSSWSRRSHRYGKFDPGLWVCDPRCYGGGHFPGAKFLRKLSFNSSRGRDTVAQLYKVLPQSVSICVTRQGKEWSRESNSKESQQLDKRKAGRETRCLWTTKANTNQEVNQN